MNLTYSLDFSNRKQGINLRNSPKDEILIQCNGIQIIHYISLAMKQSK